MTVFFRFILLRKSSTLKQLGTSTFPYALSCIASA